MDLNWNDHPFHAYETFSRDQQDTINELLDYYEGVVRWGGEVWNGNPQDEMHWQMGFDTYRNPRTADFITRKIRSDGFSFFRKSTDLVMDRKPVTPSDGGTYWADVSQYQKTAVTKEYQYGVWCFRTNTGDTEDALVAENCAAALELLASDQLSIVIAYYFFRPGQANCDLHRQILMDHGMWLHDSTLTMVDVEGDQGRIRGDQSAEVNDEINRMRGWYGNQRRVIGYWNPNADSGLWLKRPYALELVIPQYNGRPGDLTGVTQNTVAREAFAHQYTDRATDVMPWPGQPVDMNWTPYNLAELYSVFGLPEAIKEPDTGGPLDLSTSDIEELCGAIGAQFNA